MNKITRRSNVRAAGVTGAWALGSAVAGADELPAATATVPDARVPDVSVDTADTTDTVTDTADTVTDKVASTTATVQAAGQVVGDAYTVAGRAAADVPPYATGLVDDTVDSVLPPLVNTTVHGVLPVAGQAVEDAGGVAYGETGDVQVTPFAEQLVTGDVQSFARPWRTASWARSPRPPRTSPARSAAPPGRWPRTRSPA